MTSATALWIVNALVNFGIIAVTAVGLNVSFGMAGITDLAFFFFVAIGAYMGGVFVLGPSDVSLQLYHILGLSLPWPVAVLAGAAAAGFIGWIVGIVALRRLRSDYLAIVMFAVWSIGYSVITNKVSLFNGSVGLYNVSQPFGNVTTPLNYPWVFLPIVMVVLLILVVVAYAIERSAFGRTVRAVRDDGDLAEALGKTVTGVRVRAMVIGCAYAGFAGALFIFYLGAYNPSAWFIFETIATFGAVLIGGRGNVFGALFGAFVIAAVSQGVQFLPTIAGRNDLTVYSREALLGIILMVALFYRPEGVFRERFSVRVKDGSVLDNEFVASREASQKESIQ